MSSALETLSIQELYTRKDNLFKQINKVDEEIKRKEKELLDEESNDTLSEEIKLPKKIILKKVKKVSDNLHIDPIDVLFDVATNESTIGSTDRLTNGSNNELSNISNNESSNIPSDKKIRIKINIKKITHE
jgi:hypothetical protein